MPNQPEPRFYPLHASGKPARHAVTPATLGGLDHLGCGSHSGPWYCAQYHPGQVLLAAQNLRRQGFTFHVPLEELAPSPRTPGVPRYRPLIAGYLFVSFDAQTSRWQRLFNTYGMKRILLSSPDMPLEVPRASLAAFLAPKEPFDVQPMPAPLAPLPPSFAVGDNVDIITGPFKGNRGIVTLSTKQRLKLLMQVMGGAVEVHVKAAQLSPATLPGDATPGARAGN